MIKTELKNAAALADTTSDNVRFNWCEDGYLIAYNQSWIFTDLYAVNIYVNTFSFFTLTAAISYSKLVFWNSCIYIKV